MAQERLSDELDAPSLRAECERLRAQVETLSKQIESWEHSAIPPQLDVLIEGVQVIDYQWRYVYLNAAAARHGKREPAQLIGRSMIEAYPGIDSTPMFKVLKTCMETRCPQQLLNRFTYSDGTSRYFDLRISPVPVGIAVVSFDISAQQASEDALRESENDLEIVLQTLGEAVIVVDTRGAVVRMNQIAERLTGYEVRGRALATEVVALRRSDESSDLTAELLKNVSESASIESAFLTSRDGTSIAVAARVAPLMDQQGVRKGAVLVLRDQREERSLGYQLQQSQKMEAVGRLAGGVAHDFNNLLTAIIGFGTLAKEGMNPNDPAYHDIAEILRAAERAEGLTKQLLAYSRKQSVVPTVVNINANIAGVDRMMRRILGEDIEFKSSLEDNLWNVRIDPVALEQVLVNLTVNARDAMPHGGRLTIETANVRLSAGYGGAKGIRIPPGEYVSIAVSDNGEGMDAETRERIFDPFFTTKPPGLGTGLGLSTCFGIVTQAGGYIWVYSERGRGTTFKVYLPRVDKGVEEGDVRPQAYGHRGNETVLVAEDDAQVRTLASRALRRLGYTVLTAESGGEALLVCEQHPGTIDLLLTDVVMPRMSGRHLASRLGRIRPAMKVIYMSGYTENAMVQNGLLDAGIATISKPFTPDGLGEKVRQVLDSPSFHAVDKAAKPRVLIIDDDQRVLRAITTLLRDDYSVVSAASAMAAQELMAVEAFDFVLCDILMPEMNGMQLYDRLRMTAPDLAERFVFVTGAKGDARVDAFLADSHRPVVAKPFDLKSLQSVMDQVLN